MLTSGRRVGDRVLRISFVLCLILGAFAPPARGQDRRRLGDTAAFIGCGKARAAVKHLRARSVEPPDAAYLEAMHDTDVQHYALDIEITNIDPSNNTCTITGSNTITIRSQSPSLDQFTFRLRDQYAVTGAYIDGTTPVSVATVSTSTRVVTLDRTYGVDEVFELTIEYTGDTVSAAFGSIEVDTHSGGIPVVSTLSEPYYAYTWWPVKDGDVGQPGDNSDKATLEFSVTVPGNFTVASNGSLNGVDTLPGGRKRYRWATGYPIATYLVSFSATEYNTWTVAYDYPGGSMPVEFFIYESWDTPANRAGWESVIDMLEVFRPIFGEYPFIDEKYGIYNFPFAGMEHQTITGQGGFGEFLTAHELAHQWWGDVITCKTWNHIWLNEGFATYAEGLWAEHKAGGSDPEALKSYMAKRRYVGAGSVYVYDDELDNLWEIFNGATSYSKGAWVLHMLRHVLGDADFFAALAAYRAAYENSAAATEDFQAVCESFYAGDSLDWFFREWVYGERAPAYEWGWDTVTVNGQDYLLLFLDQTQAESYQRFTMPIDIVVDGDTRVAFNNADPQHFVIPVPAVPVSVEFDPDAWILRSAAVETGYVPGPPTIVETVPAPGEAVDYLEAVESLAVAFHTRVNVSPGDVSLVGASTGPWTFTPTCGTNVNPVILGFPYPLLPDSYTLTVRNSVESSDSMMALDGEVVNPNDPASLPSGDGVEGGDAVIRFTVTSSFTPGDFDGDGALNLGDLDGFIRCLSGPGGPPLTPQCQPADLDRSGAVDLADFRVLQAVY